MPLTLDALRKVAPVGTIALLFAVALLACGGGHSSIDLPSPVAHTSAAALDFGLSDCGATGNPVTIAVTNDATALPLSWTASTEGPFALVGSTQGTLTSHESATLTVVPKVPSTADAAMPVTGTLKLVTNDPRNPELRIPLTALARGASLSFPATVDFGEIPLTASSPPVPIAFKNLGNAPVDVDLAQAANPDFIRLEGAIHLEPGQEVSASYRFSPSQWAVETSSAAVATKGAVCGAPPPPFALTGRGTKGVVLTSPGKLDFGLVDCGTQAQAKTVLVQNTGNASFDVSAALTGGTWFTVSPTTGTLQPGDSLTLTVVPSGVPAVSAVTPDLYSDTLTITTTALGDLPHVVDLHETARGAVLSFSPTVAPGRVLIDTVKTLPFAVANSGNVPVFVSGASPDNVLSIQATAVADDGLPVSAPVDVRPDPAQIGQDEAVSLPLIATGPVCGPSWPTVTGVVRAYDTALDVDAVDGFICVIGHTHRVYCICNACDLLGLPGPSGMRLVPNLLADQVALGPDDICFLRGSQLSCASHSTPNPYAISLPAGSTGLWGTVGYGSFPFQACITSNSGLLSCFGDNTYGAMGNGATSTTFQTSLSPAMMGQAPISGYTSNGKAGYAVVAGSVLAAGDSSWGELGNAGVPVDTVVATPVMVDSIHDAVAVAAVRFGACAMRSNGAVSCWGDGDPTPLDRGGLGGVLGAVAIAPTGVNFGWALLASGDVLKWNGAAREIANAFLHLPVVKLRGISIFGGPYAIEAGGEVSRLGSNGPWRVTGFEGP